MTETRTLYEYDESLSNPAHIHGWGDGSWCVDGDMRRLTLTPIPWCTTHDHHSYQRGPGPDECDRWVVERDCEISLGGPSHRWWRIE